MRTRSILILLGVVVLLVVLYYSFQTEPDTTAYTEELLAERQRKDRDFREGSESPFAGQAETFTGLKYYPPDPAYRIRAKLKPISSKKVRMLATSDNKQERYLEYAWAEFDLDGVTNSLLILEIMENGPNKGTLFIAFADATSANETYGGGRYLDVKKVPAATSIELDFNRAYNPYCAYNETYSCPLPPPENLLNVAIPAGEKVYKDPGQGYRSESN